MMRPAARAGPVSASRVDTAPRLISSTGSLGLRSSAVYRCAIAASVLRPPPDDPRRGLIALLGREHARRSARYQSFKRLWDQQMADGVRADLARLSTGGSELAGSGEIPTR